MTIHKNVRPDGRTTSRQAKWGPEYEKTLFSGGMVFSDGGRVVEDKILRAVVEQGDFLAAFTGAFMSFYSSTRVTKSYLLALGTTQISSYFTKH